MNGFTAIELEQPGFVGRVFGRKPKENALREIQNFLAQKSVHDLTAADVENVLSNYELTRPEAHDGLRAFYRSALDYRAKRDLHLSDDEIAELRQLRYVLGLDEADAKEIELELLRELYRAVLRHALVDGILSDAEKSKLDLMGANFDLPQATRDSIYKDEVLTVMQEAFNKAVADRRLTDEEEKHLARMGENLGVKIAHDADSRARIDRFRLLARIENGELPTIQPGVILQRAETCHAQLACSLHELRTVTKSVRYQGPSGRIRIMKGLSWRYGQISVNRVTSEELRQLDAGTLFITNKRLLFNGANKNANTPLKRVIHFTLYTDGIRIEKDSGRDQIFKGEGDIELTGLILESVLRRA